MSEFSIDQETADLIVEMLGEAAIGLGASASIVVPAAAVVKLAGRLAANGVTIPDNPALTRMQELMRERSDLPDMEG